MKSKERNLQVLYAERQEMVLHLLKNGRSKSEVAVLMGISRQRVQQIAKKV